MGTRRSRSWWRSQSTTATESEVLQALEAGAVDHVTKPFSVPVLIQRVRRAMER